MFGGVLVTKVKLRSAIRGNHHRDGHPRLHRLGEGVEFLDERHDVQAALAERRADRRRRIGLAGGNLQLDVADDFLRHVIPGPCPRDRGANDPDRHGAANGLPRSKRGGHIGVGAAVVQ